MAMQLFIGGACAGKRDTVTARFPTARWWQLSDAAPLGDCQHALTAEQPLVITGVLTWLAAALDATASDAIAPDLWRSQWQDELAALCQRAEALHTPLIIIATEVGRGIVPMQPQQRRLRDVNGWFNQDAAAQANQVWYVRHGLVQALKG